MTILLQSPDEVASRFQAAKLGLQIFRTLADETDIESLEAEFSARGLPMDELPKRPDRCTAFGRAVHDMNSERTGIWVAPKKYGGTLVRSENAPAENARPPKHGNVMTAYWDEKTDEPVFERLEACMGDEEYDRLRAEINLRYEVRKTTYNVSDLNGAMQKMIFGRLDGLTLNPSGYVYSVPKEHVLEWFSREDAIRAANPRIRTYSFPMGHDDVDVVRAIFDALDHEVTTLDKELSRDLSSGEAVGTQEKGPRAFENRAIDAQVLKAKVGRYEALIEREQPVLHARLQEISVRAAQASMALKAAKAEAKAKAEREAAEARRLAQQARQPALPATDEMAPDAAAPASAPESPVRGATDALVASMDLPM